MGPPVTGIARRSPRITLASGSAKEDQTSRLSSPARRNNAANVTTPPQRKRHDSCEDPYKSPSTRSRTTRSQTSTPAKVFEAQKETASPLTQHRLNKQREVSAIPTQHNDCAIGDKSEKKAKSKSPSRKIRQCSSSSVTTRTSEKVSTTQPEPLPTCSYHDGKEGTFTARLAEVHSQSSSHETKQNNLKKTPTKKTDNAPSPDSKTRRELMKSDHGNKQDSSLDLGHQMLRRSKAGNNCDNDNSNSVLQTTDGHRLRSGNTTETDTNTSSNNSPLLQLDLKPKVKEASSPLQLARPSLETRNGSLNIFSAALEPHQIESDSGDSGATALERRSRRNLKKSALPNRQTTCLDSPKEKTPSPRVLAASSSTADDSKSSVPSVSQLRQEKTKDPLTKETAKTQISTEVTRSPLTRSVKSPLSKDDPKMALMAANTRSPLTRSAKSPLSEDDPKMALFAAITRSPLTRSAKSPLAPETSKAPVTRVTRQSPLPTTTAASPISRQNTKSPIDTVQVKSPLTVVNTRSQLTSVSEKIPLTVENSTSAATTSNTREVLEGLTEDKCLPVQADSTDEEDEDPCNFYPRRKKLRSEVSKDELWEGFPLSVCFKRLAPITKSTTQNEAANEASESNETKSADFTETVCSDSDETTFNPVEKDNSIDQSQEKKTQNRARVKKKPTRSIPSNNLIVQNNEKETIASCSKDEVIPTEVFQSDGGSDQAEVATDTEEAMNKRKNESEILRQCVANVTLKEKNANTPAGIAFDMVNTHQNNGVSTKDSSISIKKNQDDDGQKPERSETQNNSPACPNKSSSSNRKRKHAETTQVKRSARLSEKLTQAVGKYSDFLYPAVAAQERSTRTAQHSICSTKKVSREQKHQQKSGDSSEHVHGAPLTNDNRESSIFTGSVETEKQSAPREQGNMESPLAKEPARMEEPQELTALKGSAVSTVSDFSIEPVINNYSKRGSESSMLLLETIFQKKIQGAETTIIAECGNSLTVDHGWKGADISKAIALSRENTAPENETKNDGLSSDRLSQPTKQDVKDDSISTEQEVKDNEPIDVGGDKPCSTSGIGEEQGPLTDPKNESLITTDGSAQDVGNERRFSPKFARPSRREAKSNVANVSWQRSPRVLVDPLELSPNGTTCVDPAAADKKTRVSGPLPGPSGLVKFTSKAFSRDSVTDRNKTKTQLVPPLRIKLRKSSQPNKKEGLKKSSSATITVELSNKESESDLSSSEASDAETSNVDYMSEDPFAKCNTKKTPKKSKIPKTYNKGKATCKRKRSSPPLTAVRNKLRLNSERRLSEVENLLANPMLNKHACVIWSSEQRRHQQTSHPDASATEIDETLRLRWEELGEKEKLRYFQRARNAIRDENRHSNNKHGRTGEAKKGDSESVAKEETSVSQPKSPSMEKFESLSSGAQLKELEKWLHFYHEVSPEEYTRCMDSFKADLNAEREKRTQENTGSTARKSKRNKKEKTKAKTKPKPVSVDEDSHAKYRRLLYSKILLSMKRVTGMFYEKREIQKELFKENYSKTVKRLISGGGVAFAGDVQSDQLTELLTDIRALESADDKTGSQRPTGSQSYQSLVTELINEAENGPTDPGTSPFPASEVDNKVVQELSDLEDTLVKTAEGELPNLNPMVVEEYMQEITGSRPAAENKLPRWATRVPDSGSYVYNTIDGLPVVLASPSTFLADWVSAEVLRPNLEQRPFAKDGSIRGFPNQTQTYGMADLVSNNCVPGFEYSIPIPAHRTSNGAGNMNQNCNSEPGVQSSKYVANFRSFSKQARSDHDQDITLYQDVRPCCISSVRCSSNVPSYKTPVNLPPWVPVHVGIQHMTVAPPSVNQEYKTRYQGALVHPAVQSNVFSAE